MYLNNTLYTQVIHLAGVAALAILGALGKISATEATSGIAILVGIALPSPFSSTPSK